MEKPRQTFAITVWENRVSPVFDAAQMLLIAEFAGSSINQTHYRRFQPEHIVQLIELLKDERVGVLICGAVSQEPAELLEAAGIELIPFISGNVHRILERIVQDVLILHDLVMPGCRNQACCKASWGLRRHGRREKNKGRQ